MFPIQLVCLWSELFVFSSLMRALVYRSCIVGVGLCKSFIFCLMSDTDKPFHYSLLSPCSRELFHCVILYFFRLISYPVVARNLALKDSTSMKASDTNITLYVPKNSFLLLHRAEYPTDPTCHTQHLRRRCNSLEPTTPAAYPTSLLCCYHRCRGYRNQWNHLRS